MSSFPAYDSDVPDQYYDSFGGKESTRLSRDPAAELLYHLHTDVFPCYIHNEASLLELGAGAGIVCRELATLAGQLMVSDISQSNWRSTDPRWQSLNWKNAPNAHCK